MIVFKKLEVIDIPLLLNWFKKDHIKDIWVSIVNKTDDEIVSKYVERLNKSDIEMFIIQKNNINIGYIQTYIVENTKPFQIMELSKGIDLFIGEEKYINKGLGAKILKKFINEHVFNDPLINYTCIDPEVRNIRAIKCYEKVGFKFVNEDYCDYSKLLTYYMILSRSDFNIKKGE